MHLQNFTSSKQIHKQHYNEIAVVSDNQDKLLKIRSLLENLDIPVYLFLVGDRIFKEKINPEIIFLENVSKIENFFPTNKNRIYLACFD